MKVGDILVDVFGKQWVIYNAEGLFMYVVDFKTQTQRQILLPAEIIEVIEKPDNVEFMFLNRRAKDLEDVKEYV